MLTHSDHLMLLTDKSCNPAQFLYGEPQENLVHDCLEIVKYQTKVREDLTDQPLGEGESIFTDGSSRCVQGKRCSGYVIVDGNSMEVIEKGKLPPRWSAQCCEFYALKRGLEYLDKKKGTIYTDSRYAYGVVHTSGKI